MSAERVEVRAARGDRRVVIAHPVGGPFVRHSVMGLNNARMLEFFATTFIDHRSYPLARRLKNTARAVSPALVRQLERRAFEEIPYDRLRTRPWWELARTFSSNVLRAPVLTDLIWERGERAFDRWVAHSLPNGVDAVYTYEHAALETLLAARARRAVAFYEQPSQHHTFFSRIVAEQTARYPEIANSASALVADGKAHTRNLRRDAELAAADCIVCNSTFTRRTLVEAGIDPAKIEVTPLGFPEPDPRPPAIDGPVIFLNAGTQNLRKGLHLLYRAWRELNFRADQAELWLVGRMVLPEATRSGLPGRVRILDSVPRAELLGLYGQASVFVLPSLADGFGMAVTEAMSRGLAVITTQNTAGPDIIRHGETGMIVGAGNVAALREQMRWCVDNRDGVAAIGARAAQAAKRWQWTDYEKSFASIIDKRIAAAGR